MAAPAQTSPVPTGPELDNRRVAAALIDLLVPLAGLAAANVAGLPLTLGVVLVGVGWTLYYFFALESGDGQTLGKRAMNLRVVSADGKPASMEQIAKRTAIRIVDGHIVGLIVMLVTGDRRLRLGDILAGTVVTDAESAPGPATRALALAPAPARPADKPSLVEPPDPKPAVAKKPSLLKRRLSLPAFASRARRGSATDTSAPTRAAGPGPGAAPAPSVPDPAPAVSEPAQPAQSDRLSEALRAGVPRGRGPRLDLDGPEPLVELDRPEAWDPADEPDPLADLGGGEPNVDVEVDELAADGEPESPSEEDTGVTIKPIETVSAIDLVMQDAEERRPAGG